MWNQIQKKLCHIEETMLMLKVKDILSKWQKVAKWTGETYPNMRADFNRVQGFLFQWTFNT